MRDMDINVATNSCVTKQFTKHCRRNGYRPGIVLKYLVENKSFFDEVCNTIIFEDKDAYMNAVMYQKEVSVLSKCYGTSFTLKSVSSQYTLKELLQQYNISIVFFFCYLAANGNVVDFICSHIPNELKLKKCK